MQNFKLKLTINGPRNFKGKLTVQCYQLPGKIRHYMLVPGIESVSLEKWSDEMQCFICTDKTALHNNGTIDGVMTRLKELTDAYVFASGKELFDAYKGGSQQLIKKGHKPKSQCMGLEKR